MSNRQPTKRSQQLVFTLYGDYLRDRAAEVWTGSLISLLEPFGLSAQAVRSTLSRMSRMGWLSARREGRLSYYRLTARGQRIVEEAGQHLFETGREPWDGRWRLVTYSIPERQRHLRDRLRQRLIWLGFGHLSAGSWISPYAVPPELVRWLESTGARPYADLFTAEFDGPTEARQLVARAWNMDLLHAAYSDFLGTYEADFGRSFSPGSPGLNGLEPSEAFVRRVQLTLDVLSFPYVDPRLPMELLPAGWLGDRAAGLFQRYHEALAAPALRFVAEVQSNEPTAAPSPSRRPSSSGGARRQA